jgi:hypothetical protein
VNTLKLRLIGLMLIAAFVMAFLLRDVVEQLVVRPAAYLFWSLGIFYRFIPQPVLWMLLVLAMLYLTLGSFAGKFRWPRRAQKAALARGPLDELARQIEHKNDGIYFKWQIARTLGEVALDLQELRQHIRRRKLDFDPGQVSDEVRNFLEAGLETSFSDYPMTGGLPLPGKSKAVPITPFDGDVSPVLDYLETQMENNDDRRRA